MADLSEDQWRDVAAATQMVRAKVGDWTYTPGAFDPWPDIPGRPRGLVPMLALLASVDQVREFHASRGISERDTYTTLSDLTQQILVFRRTFGEFGLDNHQWLLTAWSGALYWLGRLQVNLHPVKGDERDLPFDDGYLLSVHIPATGPLTPESVDDSLRRAWAFFAEHFADLRIHAFHCDSWLLDPQIAAVLSPESNMAKFQRRWTLYGQAKEADDAVLYFTFNARARPGEQLDRSALPRRSSLERAVLEHLDAGEHWHSRTGFLNLT